MKNKIMIWSLVVLFSVLMSIPWLVPHCGWVALFGILPLLLADDLADNAGVRHFWIYHYTAFVLWNAATTFWVCNATVGGGIFAILYNSLQMSLVFGLFRLGRKKLDGALPYLFLAAAWIAWEKVYFNLDMSWPWLVLGNAFARTTTLVQWYEYTGTLGGSLWIWAVNLCLFGLFKGLVSGFSCYRTRFSFISAHIGTVLLIAVPMLISGHIYRNYEGKSEGALDVLIAQPDFDPYEKFSSVPRKEQNRILLGLYEEALQDTLRSGGTLLLAPETFTDDVIVGEYDASPTIRSFRAFLEDHPGCSILFGASTYDLYPGGTRPSILARSSGSGWYESHNSALVADPVHDTEIYHKSKLVVGTELTPCPKVFVPIENFLCRIMGVRGLMGHCVGQDEISLLHPCGVPVGCAVCYESIYGEFCTGYVRKGAEAMCVITNDAWWGDTPGYRQHLSYARLRAIELRRDFARCANTGISAMIDRKGDIVSQTSWWTRTTLAGTLNLSTEKTFFVRYGDICGRICTLVFLLLLAMLVVRIVIKK